MPGPKSSRNLCPAGQKKFKTVMEEYKNKKLKSSSGDLVTTRKQALAIAFSEARKLCETKKK